MIDPQSRRFIRTMVAAQAMVQIGAFTLPALLPGYIERWQLSKTEAGWLAGVFFAAYVVAVPGLVALTDRIPTRRVYELPDFIFFSPSTALKSAAIQDTKKDR